MGAGVLSEHYPIGIQAVRWHILPVDSSISCLEEGEIESSRHLLLECPLFAGSILKNLGSITHGLKSPGPHT